MKTIEAISEFIKGVPVNYATDLTAYLNGEMECQVMVDPTGGEPVYEGDRPLRNVWAVNASEYGIYKFYHIRIPKNSMSEPHYNNPEMKFPLSEHIECIGMTGWNWLQKKSLWVAFDFDSITGHAQGVGISKDSLEQVKEAASQIPWVQIRKSTSGTGLHLYVFFDPVTAPNCENHTVHAALARTVLGLMERESKFDFRANIDVLGGNMWVWHRKISEFSQGLSIQKDFQEYCPDLPSNWRDNVDVIQGKTEKVRFRGVGTEDQDSFEAQSNASRHVQLDNTHKLIEERIHQLGYSIVWVPDYHCWQTHSKALQELMENYPDDYTGVFKTLSSGSDRSKPNSFMFPLQNGGMKIIRFGRGAKEHETWHQKSADWTWTYFNTKASLSEASLLYGGVKDPDNDGWVFQDLNQARKVCQSLGEDVNFEGMESPFVILRPNKRDQLVLEIPKIGECPDGWLEKGKRFIRLCGNAQTSRIEDSIDLSDRVRALVDVNNEFAQWVLKNNEGVWVVQNKDNIRSALRVLDKERVEDILGQMVIENWKLVNVPFQPEYIGQRQWNRNAPQFAVQPGDRNLEHVHWDMLLEQLGQDLDEGVKHSSWCREAGIFSGQDYLTYWISFMLRDPYCKLPYLFFFGPQNSGKSTFHEAISLLITKGVVNADNALKSKEGYNGELAGCILAVVEETNLSEFGKGSTAYDRIKAWTTAEELSIHAKFHQPYQQRNTTHWVQMANNKDYCPVFPGDTRIVMAYVPMLDGDEIPKDILMTQLKREAPAFLRTLLDIRLPKSQGRLRLPIIMTETREEVETSAKNVLDDFIQQRCHQCPGGHVKLKDFYTAFSEWVNDPQWTYNRVVSEFRNRDILPFGRLLNNVTCVGNILLEPPDPEVDYGPRLIRHKQKLVRGR